MELISKTIHLRLVEISDAGFILSLRTDPRYNKFLTAVDPDLEKQVEWLKEYKRRERENKEYYFIICRNSDDLPIGTVRIYDFLDGRESFCWGSWILNQNKTTTAALESTLLIYDYAFMVLGFKRCHIDVRKENVKVIEYHKKFGVLFVAQTENDVKANYCYDDYMKIRGKFRKMLGLAEQ